MKIRVYYEDVDAGGICYHSRYLNFCERARSELFFAKGLSPIDGEYHFVVRHINADFFAPARFGDLISVTSSISKIKAASITMRQEIYDQKGLLLFGMDLLLVCLRGESVSKIPEGFREVLN